MALSTIRRGRGDERLKGKPTFSSIISVLALCLKVFDKFFFEESQAGKEFHEHDVGDVTRKSG